MSEVFVATKGDFGVNDRKIVRNGRTEIGIFYRDGAYFAYENTCVHQGGPACEGLIMGKVEEIIATDKTYRGQRFSKDETHFVCPWHGYEYDLKTGECVADRRLRLRKFEVVTRGDDVYVIV
jgi:nitrite reductase/ring-hydroxylating ferredoxin subunit